ncbi:glycosyl transferase [Allgaiera indica]|uniref:Glycosyl transferase n=1 Tax=Allgaiera indica TaxID=765699 RepID=A0AAN4ZY30_9RHOB|nr:glycosyltransferase [Allgaiera indica]GHD99002.1 glycosyl transferase [Allgaiera indica]SDW02049.1 UDP-N-acetylmuramyl pentapeptide phosphotransferase/UDP-N-acetylglucosamine-1-phosphate transferase [Allgaiera indica]
MLFVPLLVAFLTSLAIGGVILRTRHLHGQFTVDGTIGAQKIHRGEVPRIGGLAVGVGLLAGGLWMSLAGVNQWWLFAVCAVPVFIAGFWEDLTKRVSVMTRLLATIMAGMIFSNATGYALHHLDIPGVDSILAVPLVALFFTGFAIGGVANALNIIDGCNGLASGAGMILLGAFGLIAWQAGDIALMSVSLTTLCAVGGFFALNFPSGRIFLGDAGAYSIGFLLAALAVALPARNPEISPIIGLLVLIYPVSETVFSILRRMGRGNGAVGRPDRQHLHSIVFRALNGVIENKTHRNSTSAAVLWLLPLISSVMAVVVARDSTAEVLAVTLLNVLLYRGAYGLAVARARVRRRLGGVGSN